MEEYDNNKFKNNEFYFEFLSNVAATAQELKIGFFGKAKYLATIWAKLILLGMSEVDADYIQGLMEIEMQKVL